jgi:hypothetical protein
VLPLAKRGLEVYFTNRWPGMPVDISFAEIAVTHAVRRGGCVRRADWLDGIQTETLVVCGAKDCFWTPEMFVETADGCRAAS